MILRLYYNVRWTKYTKYSKGYSGWTKQLLWPCFSAPLTPPFLYAASAPPLQHLLPLRAASARTPYHRSTPPASICMFVLPHVCQGPRMRGIWPACVSRGCVCADIECVHTSVEGRGIEGVCECHHRHLHQSRGWLGAWVSHGNRPLVVITSSVSTYLPLLLMTPAPVIVCHHPPPSAPSVDVPVTSLYVCMFWTLLPPSIWHIVRLEDEVIITSFWDHRSRTRFVFKDNFSVLGC